MKYINRKLAVKETHSKYGDYYPVAGEGLYTLMELLEEGKKRILLLGDAGYGKSFELTHITNKFLDRKDINHIPIPIPFDTYVDEEIEAYILYHIRKESISVLERPPERLIFLFDEFDQVLKRDVAIRKVSSFIKLYRDSTFIIAARTNSYSNEFERILNTYYLQPYTWENVVEYVISSCNKPPVFFKGIESIPHKLICNPFFLHQMVHIFNEQESITRDIKDIFSTIIKTTLSNELTRYSHATEFGLKEIDEALEELSLVMEMVQKNYITVSDLRKIIIDEKKRDIIINLSLLKGVPSLEGHNLQFQHNNFQEYFAAKKLTKQNASTVLDLISFRSRRIPSKAELILSKDYFEINVPFVTPKIRNILIDIVNCIRYKRIDRINPSWLNTVSFLCQLDSRDYLRNYLGNVEPGLILKIEKSRLDYETAETLFRSIFERYTAKNIWLDRDKIDYQQLADLSDSKNTIELLMSYAKSKEHFIHRNNAIEILSRKTPVLSAELKNELKELIISYIKDENENDNVRHTCFYALARLDCSDSSTIDRLLYLQDSNNDWVLAGLYYLIKRSNEIDKYVDTIISGIKNTRRELMDISINVNDSLEKIQDLEGIKRIITYLEENPLDYEHYHIDRSIKAIVSNAVKSYKIDNSLYDSVSQLVQKANMYHQSDLVNTFQPFFMETGTSFRLFQDLLGNTSVRNYELLAVVADTQSIELLLTEYRNQKIDDLMMSRIVSYISFRDKADSKGLINLINTRTNKFYFEPPIDYQKEREKELNRKIDIIFNKEEFIKEVEKIYRGVKGDRIGYKDAKEMMQLSETDYNSFVLFELYTFLRKEPEKKWELDELITIISKDYDFFTVYSTFRIIEEVNKLELSEHRKNFIKHYCTEKCKDVNFRNALSPSDGSYKAGKLAIVIWYFLQEYNLDYPEKVLLDMLSFHWSENAEFDWINFLDSRLPKDKVITRVLENIKSEVRFDSVLRNHIFLCKKYRLLESKEFLFRTTKDASLDIRTRSFAVEAVGVLPETEDFLEELLNFDEVEIFKKASDALVKLNKKKTEKNLLRKLSSENEQIRLVAIELLVELQNLDGIKAYCDYLKKTKKYSEIYMPHKSPLEQIETTEAITDLIDLLEFYYCHTNEFVEDAFNSLDRDIKEALQKIALKDYRSLERVRDGLLKVIRDTEKESAHASFLHMTIERIENTFYTSAVNTMTLNDAIEITRRLQ